MADQDYLDRQTKKPYVQPAAPKRTVEYLEALMLEKDQRITTLEAELEHLTIRLGKYVNIITANNLDPQHKVHHHSGGVQKAKA